MKNQILVLAILLMGSVSAFALKAGPYILSGNVKSSDAKTVTMIVGDEEAVVPMKLIPKSQLRDGKVANGAKLTFALSEAESKQVKVHSKE